MMYKNAVVCGRKSADNPENNDVAFFAPAWYDTQEIAREKGVSEWKRISDWYIGVTRGGSVDESLFWLKRISPDDPEKQETALFAFDDSGMVVPISEWYSYMVIGDDENEYILVQKGEQWGYIDKTGKEIAFYDDATDFKNGYAVVSENGKAHFINEEMEKISEEFECDSASVLGNGIYSLRTEEKQRILIVGDYSDAAATADKTGVKTVTTPPVTPISSQTNKPPYYDEYYQSYSLSREGGAPAVTSTPSDANTLVDDKEIEAMLLSYIRGEGKLDKSMLKGVKSLYIGGTDVVKVNSFGTFGGDFDSRKNGEFTKFFCYDDMNVLYPVGKIKSLSFIEGMTNLKELTINFASIKDISPLSNLTKLERLNLSYNNVSDISPLKNLTSLVSLDLDSNKIKDISALKKLTKLTNLGLASNSISDISVLSNLTKLSILGLSGNNISVISALKDLTELKTLIISFNNITDISHLKKLTKLETLSVSFNNISDISVLSNLTKLTFLDLLSNSRIKSTDISKLQKKLKNCTINY